MICLFAGINVSEGVAVWQHALIALAICFSILATFTITVNLITKYCTKRQFT